MNMTPKQVSRLLRWRWWFLAAALVQTLSIVDDCIHHSAIRLPMLPADWGLPIMALSSVGLCFYAGMIWYAYFYWKRRFL